MSAGKNKLSDAQRLGLTLASEAPLVRWPGGYWTREGEPCLARNGSAGESIPVRHVPSQTVYGLTARGLLARLNPELGPYETDLHLITQAGKAALAASRLAVVDGGNVK